MDGSLPGSSVHGILQARILEYSGVGCQVILEWVAVPFSRGSSQPRDQTHVSCVSCIAGRFLLLSHRERPSLFECVCVRVCVYCVWVCVYIYAYISICHIFFFHAADNGHFACFSVSINVNSATGNTGEHVSFRSMISLRVEALEWERRSRVSFWLFKNLYAVLHCDCYQLTFSVTAQGGSLVIVCYCL